MFAYLGNLISEEEDDLSSQKDKDLLLNLMLDYSHGLVLIELYSDDLFDQIMFFLKQNCDTNVILPHVSSLRKKAFSTPFFSLQKFIFL